ncbi:DUF6429 family protein [Paraburkholderia tropica]|uniref:DUF6429 family protein n=2 Tax=Paraburkholderia tropica TaxID=92647 RepID=UPI00359F4FE6
MPRPVAEAIRGRSRGAAQGQRVRSGRPCRGEMLSDLQGIPGNPPHLGANRAALQTPSQALSLYAPTVSEATREPRGTRLHHRGLIAHPVNKAKSVVFTDAGLRESERLFKLYFVDGCRRPDR